jgi:hypothetical protein
MSRSEGSGNRSPLPGVPIELDEIGLGPESALMREPKLFLERSFLSLLMSELTDQFGVGSSQRALFQIGAWHGIRDARRTWQAPAAYDTDRGDSHAAPSPHLTMRLISDSSQDDPNTIRGVWPDHHEAHARLDQGPQTTEPTCFLSTGYTSGWLSETYGRDFIVVEESCLASGDLACRFRAVPSTISSTTRASGQNSEGEIDPGETTDSIDQREAIHIWGPVMVLPCEHPEIALATLKHLLTDASLRDVRVVVLDLMNRLTLSGTSPHPIENLLDAIDSWGVEALLTGIRADTLQALSDLNRPLLIGPQRFSESIAMAFQVAEAGLHAA